MNTLYKNLLLFVLMFIVASAGAQIKLQPFAGFGSQSIDYTYDGASIEGSSGLSLGADLYYYLSEDLAVGTGIRFSSYKASSVLNDFTAIESGIDMDGDSYELTKSTSGISETHTLSAIEIPLLLRYQKWVSGSFIVFGATGPVFIVPGSLKTKFDGGSITTSGYYENWNLTIDEAEGYGFGVRALETEKPDLTAKTSMAWAVEVGAEYFINKRLNLMMTLYYQPSVSSVMEAKDHSDDPFAFVGSMAGASEVKISKVGIRFGINFDLTPPEKSSIRSIR